MQVRFLEVAVHGDEDVLKAPPCNFDQVHDCSEERGSHLEKKVLCGVSFNRCSCIWQTGYKGQCPDKGAKSDAEFDISCISLCEGGGVTLVVMDFLYKKI